jgi:excinuclease ABC subunit C
VQALVWEADLVKSEQPPFNTKLKDDKHFLYIRVGEKDRWPRPTLERRMSADGARYFGPFPSATKVRETLRAVRWVFPWCDNPPENADRPLKPCSNYRYFPGKLCPGPCAGAIDESEYRLITHALTRFFEGRVPHVLETLEREMQDAADRLLFERAADMRNRLNAARAVVSAQREIYNARVDEDIVGLARDNGQACAQVLLIRQGRLVRESSFPLEHSQGDSDGALLSAFVKQFYDQAAELPAEVVLPSEVEDGDTIEEWLRERRGARVRLVVPRRGQRLNMVRLAGENARATLDRIKAEWQANTAQVQGALLTLQEHLQLPTLPRRIECYDISNIQGTSPVASMVVFENAQPRRSDYKRFQIKTVLQADDFSMMQEVLRRRLKRAAEAVTEDGDASVSLDEPSASVSGWARLPDLLIVDGGKGQLNAALEVLRELGLDELPIAGLAKEEEILFVPSADRGQARTFGIFLPRASPALFLVQRVRDEAHRFAVTYHRKVRGKSGLGSALDEVPGIGPKRKRALLRRFGSLKGIREASAEELASVPGMTVPAANAILTALS